ncbi:PQQ-dependent sugar dehydrogenase [Winogradskyella luteola]|uniref:PQQ-dependent sugar dehydrogenase n=1 Tax=Winogradskyella luteola TaxID=2828330 RepID=A0A9X1JT31_9FLAO|nr:PQQ-dependent sugar dehydrogenase [Winogradskyella luteola]MBV7270232.1 PQQ-dependent sugar dehydrogenase [Winogradskyella luteola]
MKTLTSLVFCVCFAFVQAQQLDLELFASGLNRPVNIKHAGDDRLFVAEQDGLIKIINSDGTVESTPFLNIDPRVRSVGNEQGLLGLAFHPDYDTNGHFFVNYINLSGDTVVSRFTRDTSNPSIADSNSELIILTFSQPFSNHNGGELQFGPDGYLYISSGDGGSGGDPQDNGQDLGNLLGKLIRIDVNNSTSTNPYVIPSDNPFVGIAGNRGEIWAYGLRNPWKFSFDRMNSDLWIGDVGQSAREEVNNVPSTTAGVNYGWRCYEGNNTFNTTGCPSSSTLTFPVFEYAHGTGRCSITGGYVYRGSDYPNFDGLYFFADVCSQEVGYIEFDGANWNSTFEDFSGALAAFGEDINGELYIASLGGNISKLVDTTLNADEYGLEGISIYPNPAKDELIIDFSATNTSSLEILIYDMQGKKVTSIAKNTNTIWKINTSDYAKGIYLMKINSENGEQLTHKLIVN